MHIILVKIRNRIAIFVMTMQVFFASCNKIIAMRINKGGLSDHGFSGR